MARSEPNSKHECDWLPHYDRGGECDYVIHTYAAIVFEFK